jgi:hypothetical protein
VRRPAQGVTGPDGRAVEIKIAAGIDFGTSRSGFGWTPICPAHEDPARRHIYTRDVWPGQAVPYLKTLTALMLDRTGQATAWGWEAYQALLHHRVDRRNHGAQYRDLFKLGLPGGVTALDGSTGTGHGEPADSPRRLIVAFLRNLYQTALADITRAGYSEGEVRWCLTVPAVWTDYQKQVFRHAAYEAGMPSDDGRVILALEPEAALHHVRAASAASQQDLTRPGAKVMMVDCGGGTVDITTYRNDDDGRPHEIRCASGGLLGSTYVDAALIETVLLKRFGGIEEWQQLQREQRPAVQTLLDAWERAKLEAVADLSHPLYLPITLPLARALSPAALDALPGLQNGVDDHIVITPGEVRDAFEQVVPGILEFIDEHLQSSVASCTADGVDDGPVTVLLVGGFGASPYLRQRVKQHAGGRAQLQLVPSPAAAVVTGAVHFAYAPQVRTRIARHTAGIHVSAPFDELLDPAETRYDIEGGPPQCIERFHAFVRAGEPVRSGQLIVHDYTPLKGDQTEVKVEFYISDRTDPRYVYEPGCRKLAALTVSLAKVMHRELDKRGILVHMRLGETEIQAYATLDGTEQRLDTTFAFVTG